MNEFWTSIVTIATAITGVAIVAVIVSRNAQTPEVLRSAGDAFSNALTVAVSPVAGGGMRFGNFDSNFRLNVN